MSQRDIAAAIEDIYGFQMSHEQISTITGCVMEEVEAWRNRPLSRLSACFRRLHLRIAAHGVWRQQVAVYVMLAYDVNGCKDNHGLWMRRTESKHAGCRSSRRAAGIAALRMRHPCPWMACERIGGRRAKAVFPHATVQRCITYLIRNSIRPSHASSGVHSRSS